jgi:hypothetical protein
MDGGAHGVNKDILILLAWGGIASTALLTFIFKLERGLLDRAPDDDWMRQPRVQAD